MPKKRLGGRPGLPPSNREATTLISFVLDKSGSMECIREATISGFNEFKNEQAAAKGRALFSLTLFDTEVKCVCTAVPVAEVADLDGSTYQPGSCTALYDAVGTTILAVDRFLEQARARIDQVVFVVMTDGLENASREFDRRRVFEMITDRQERCGYEFVYLGANQDSYAESAHMGVRQGRNLDYAANANSVRASMSRLSSEMLSYRECGESQKDDWFGEAGE